MTTVSGFAAFFSEYSTSVRLAHCGPNAPASDTGFVFGTVRSTRNATVSASWIDVAVSGKQVAQKQKTMEITADSLGVKAAPLVRTTAVSAPPSRKAGQKVASVEELVAKLKNEAKVL